MQKILNTVIITSYENGYLIEPKKGYILKDKKVKKELNDMGIFYHTTNSQAVKYLRTDKEPTIILGKYEKNSFGDTLFFSKTKDKFDYQFLLKECGNLVFLLNQVVDFSKEKEEEFELC